MIGLLILVAMAGAGFFTLAPGMAERGQIAATPHDLWPLSPQARRPMTG
ncbi:MAG TPA: hypothetical protein PK450_11390 [Paracoccaceae bacterium]|nr:hypothetical protein [Paracoccaceae bacterium]